MKSKKTDEFEKFDDALGKLLSVPHSELQKKLDEEKEAKKKKQKKSTSSSGRVSSKGS